MYCITWHDKKDKGWSKTTSSKDEALNTISVLFKRRIEATCRTDGMPDICGAVWQMDNGRWCWFFERGAR